MPKTLFERMAEVQRNTVDPVLAKYAASLGASGLKVIEDASLEPYGVEMHVGPLMYRELKKVAGK